MSLATDVKTRVLFINAAFKPASDTQIHALILRHLDRSRVEVHLACVAGKAGARFPSFELLSRIPDIRVRPTDFGPSLSGQSLLKKILLSVSGLSSLVSLAGLAAYIRRNRIRILHSGDRPRDALSCVLLSKLTGAKSVVHIHVGSGDWMIRPLLWALGQADALIGISSFVARSMVANGYSPERTHAVLNAIDPSEFDPRIDPGPVRQELGLPATAPVVVSISRLFHWKGQAALVRALPIVRREFPETRLVIVGEDDRAGAPDRPSFTAELKALVRELGVEDQVLFPGFRRDVPRLLAAADIFGMPSFHEPFGLVFLEAMAMKKPVVALDSGGAPEVVEHGKSGLLSQPGDVEGLAANIVTLIRDPALRARMGEYGRCQVQTRFTPRRMAEDTERVYAKVLAVERTSAGSPG